MTNVTSVIYGIVHSRNGIKCADIAKITHYKISSVSGTLTALKHRGMVFNEDSLWYGTNSVHTIKRTLNDIHESLGMSLGEWAEGYVNALVDRNIINEGEFDELIEYIKNN